MAAEAFSFGLWFDPDNDFATYLDQLDEFSRAKEPIEGIVPATFLVATIDDEIIGRTSIRFMLNDFLATEGGHLGYCVLPPHRGRGHATEILRQSLIVARSHGVGRVLVTCDDDNTPSAIVIERCGGVYESTVPNFEGGRSKRRFWID